MPLARTRAGTRASGYCPGADRIVQPGVPIRRLHTGQCVQNWLTPRADWSERDQLLVVAVALELSRELPESDVIPVAHEPDSVLGSLPCGGHPVSTRLVRELVTHRPGDVEDEQCEGGPPGSTPLVEPILYGLAVRCR